MQEPLERLVRVLTTVSISVYCTSLGVALLLPFEPLRLSLVLTGLLLVGGPWLVWFGAAFHGMWPFRRHLLGAAKRLAMGAVVGLPVAIVAASLGFVNLVVAPLAVFVAVNGLVMGREMVPLGLARDRVRRRLGWQQLDSIVTKGAVCRTCLTLNTALEARCWSCGSIVSAEP